MVSKICSFNFFLGKDQIQFMFFRWVEYFVGNKSINDISPKFCKMFCATDPK